MKKLTSSIILGSMIGASSIALMNMDKSNLKKAQRSGKRMINKAENLIEDMRSLI
jgi:Mg2+/Co2+ transporter CorB